jgi:hypothetical protein
MLLVAFVCRSLLPYCTGVWRRAPYVAGHSSSCSINVPSSAFADRLVTVVSLVSMKMVVPRAVDEFAATLTVQGASVVVATLASAPGNAPWVVGSLISWLIGLGMVLWLAGSWGAYRLALGQSRLRSLAAVTLFALFVAGPVAFLIWAARLL